MAILKSLFFSITIFTLLTSRAFSYGSESDSDPDAVAELLALESQSKSGVIHLNDNLFRRIVAGTKTPRPFSLIIFFDATQLHDKSELHLKDLKAEFSLLAKSFIANNEGTPAISKLFFCELEFRESQATFHQFGVSALPHIRIVGPNAKDVKADSHQMDAGDFSRLADSMAEFIEAKTSLVVGQIHRPPIISKKQVAFLILTFLACLPFMVKKVIRGDTLLHDWKIWLAGAVFIYFFSVSGSMYNIIRKMPMFMADQKDPSKLIFFYQGSGMQLGAEGFAIGFLYTIVGVMLAFMTHGLVLVKNVTAQRIVMSIALLISFLAVKKVVQLDNWKTGYGIHAYWPSSWN
jgi:oligosaccharyltransferase complex subunit gamma